MTIVISVIINLCIIMLKVCNNYLKLPKRHTYCKCTKYRKGHGCTFSGNHICICSSAYTYLEYFKYCKANPTGHNCICIKDGPLCCRAINIEHPCTCISNHRVRVRIKHIGHCKADKDTHECLCHIGRELCMKH